jgi:hypothetical protein
VTRKIDDWNSPGDEKSLHVDWKSYENCHTFYTALLLKELN